MRDIPLYIPVRQSLKPTEAHGIQVTPEILERGTHALAFALSDQGSMEILPG
jgi:hypothetical protein